MSANNWTICPKCKKRIEIAMQEKINNTKAVYGQFSPEEYEAAILKAREPISIDKTLREDCSFYIDNNCFFNIFYSAHCDKCDFEYEFNHSEQIRI